MTAPEPCTCAVRRQLADVPGTDIDALAPPCPHHPEPADGLTCPECGGADFELRLGGRRSGEISCRGCGLVFVTGPEPAARREARDRRVRELARLPKRELLAIVAEHARERGASWIVGGPQLWSRDELVNGVLAFEFPEPSDPAELTGSAR
jgi:hypothetical protein